MSLEQQIQDLRREVGDLRRQLAQRPMRVPGQTPFRMIYIGGGNTIDGQDGIKVSSTLITDLPSAYDPDASPSCADGIGWGTLYEDGVDRGKVLVINDTRSSFNCFLLLADYVYATPVVVTVAGGPGTMTVYVAG